MSLFAHWKKGFDAWERTTAQAFDEILRNPAVLAPAGALLSAAMRFKASTDKVAARWWGALGLSTKRDQERALHKLNQLESRLLDIGERLPPSG